MGLRFEGSKRHAHDSRTDAAVCCKRANPTVRQNHVHGLKHTCAINHPVKRSSTSVATTMSGAGAGAGAGSKGSSGNKGGSERYDTRKKGEDVRTSNIIGACPACAVRFY